MYTNLLFKAVSLLDASGNDKCHVFGHLAKHPLLGLPAKKEINHRFFAAEKDGNVPQHHRNSFAEKVLKRLRQIVVFRQRKDRKIRERKWLNRKPRNPIVGKMQNGKMHQIAQFFRNATDAISHQIQSLKRSESAKRLHVSDFVPSQVKNLLPKRSQIRDVA